MVYESRAPSSEIIASVLLFVKALCQGVVGPALILFYDLLEIHMVVYQLLCAVLFCI